jgi:hypothetical protein
MSEVAYERTVTQLVMRNHDKTHGTCPVLSEADVSAYLRDGTCPDEVEYPAIPIGKIVRKRGFWLKPRFRFHAAANCFLISTDVYSMNTDEYENERDQAYCYIADAVQTMYIGTIHRKSSTERVLNPLLEGQFPPLRVDELRYIGRVIAAI